MASKLLSTWQSVLSAKFEALELRMIKTPVNAGLIAFMLSWVLSP